MNLKIAICEDEPNVLLYLKTKIQDAFQAAKHSVMTYGYSSSLSLLKDAQTQAFNVFFLDIEMPNIDGLELAKRLREVVTERKSVIVYISNRDEMVYRSLKTNPLRFIRKSHFSEEIDETVQAIAHFFQECRLDALTIESNGRVITLQTSRIQYIEAINQVQIIHVGNQQYSVYSRISDFEEKLQPLGFLRVHKSFLVNYAHVRSITSKSVLLTNGIEIPLSKHRTAFIRQSYFDLLGEKTCDH